VIGKLSHLDVWKIETDAEMARLDFEKLLRPNHVVVVEWVSNVHHYLSRILPSSKVKYVEIEFAGKGQKRELTVREPNL